MKYKIADLIVEYEPKFDILKEYSKKFIDDVNEKTDIKICITEEMIQKVKNKAIKEPDIYFVPIDYVEYRETEKILYKELLNYDAFLLPASTVVIDDEAYIFSTSLAEGKSTHTALWLKYLKNKKPYIMNDGRTAIRIIDNEIYAYGTPFSGEYNIGENKKAKLKAISFLEKSKINFIEKEKKIDRIVDLLLNHSANYNLNIGDMSRLINIVDSISRKISIYRLSCNISEEAVLMSYNKMKED